MKRKEILLAGVLAVGIVATAAVVPMVTEARPAFEIPVEQAGEDNDLARANGQDWATVPAATVHLESAGAAVPNADDTTIEQVKVAAARTDERLYLRLSWADATRDTSTDEIRAFADAVAVQIPRDADERPPIAMGSTDNMVNVWYWGGDRGAEELLAGGPGTTTRLDNAGVTSNASYSDGRWRVAVSRPLTTDAENRTAIPKNSDMDLALAVWNGSNSERSGQKAVSEWYYLALGPGPAGPPYEALLWAVAGIGIVITTLVTIEGVRRTRGE
jgi:complex iron-sulfur molybdoenzyme family reductase subunit gamma